MAILTLPMATAGTDSPACASQEALPRHGARQRRRGRETAAVPLLHALRLGVSEFWDDDDETKLQQEQRDWAVSMTWAAPNLVCEQQLWRVMIRLFGKIPADLFRYGLKVDNHQMKTVQIGGKQVKSINISQPMCNGLQELICHPMWSGKIDLLRYALQLAVYCRVQDHVLPLGPGMTIRPQLQTAIMAAVQTLSKEERVDVVAELYYQSYLATGPGANPDVQILFRTLKESIKPARAKHPAERQIFLLRTTDIKAVRDALDSTTRFGTPVWQPCTTYWTHYKEARHEKEKYPPDMPALVDWKKKVMLHGLREKAIRTRLRELGCSDMLYDIPQSDPLPYHFASSGIASSQLSVVTGVVPMPDEEPLPPRARRAARTV